ncbi:MAG: class I SAM-dependent rRNA methyltransferase [Acidobacteria bacterium]|jgi:23S rRNA (cytosine1962-C5)-methyltransferase|nr:class I SAM-dependent rRNA methyltransferase [Acidobacteriota bacterium]
MAVDYKKLFLKPHEEKRILDGEFWAYDNEIRGSLKAFHPGELCRLYSSEEMYIATGYVNPLSTIAFRVLSYDPEALIDRDFLRRRILEADRQRLALRPQNAYYRLAYAEADFLPGLVIDRFDDYFIIQVTTAGMENFKDDVFAVIGEMYPGAVLVEKSLASAREKEGLPLCNRMAAAGAPEEKVIEVNGLKFRVDFLKSQKTGFFLDQRDNYMLLAPIAAGKEVLDAFAYAGAWGLHACRFGARHVEFLEISGEYLKQARENAALNGFAADRLSFVQDDAIKVLKEMSKAGILKDIVILDPPAFVKSRAKLLEAKRGYKEINLRALKMVRPGGYLVSCSCSHFLPRDEFIEVIHDAARDARRRIKLIELKSQPYDHAVLLPLFQSEYLKCALFYVY